MAPGTYNKLNNFWLNESMNGPLQGRLYKLHKDWMGFQPRRLNTLVAGSVAFGHRASQLSF